MISVWSWVGVILTVYGVMISGMGLYYAFSPQPGTVLSHLNPNLWWGGVILGAGLLFSMTGRSREGAS